MRAVDQVTATAIDLGMKFGPRLLVAVLILAAGYFVGRWAARMTGRALSRLQLEPPVRALLERAMQLFVLGLFAILALQNLGIELLPLIAGLSIAGAGVALAMQGVLGNVVAGFTIIFSRPFRVGDYISIAGEEGEVLDIRLFNTTLGHLDLSKVVIPNRKIVGEILHNYGRLRQLSLEVRVPHGAEDAATRVAFDVVNENPNVVREPAPVVRLLRVEPASIVLGVMPWVRVADYGPAQTELYRALLEALRAHGIAMPVPRHEVRLLEADAYLGGEGTKQPLQGRDAA